MIAGSFIDGVRNVLLTDVVPGVNVAEVAGAGVAVGVLLWGFSALYRGVFGKS